MRDGRLVLRHVVRACVCVAALAACQARAQALVQKTQAQVQAQPAVAAGVALPADGAAPAAVAQPALPQGPLVVTVLDEQIASPLAEVREGQVVLACEVPRSIPLDELASIDFRHPVALTVEWLGQDNRDLTQVAALGANNVQDIHIRVGGVPAGRGIAQIVVAGTPANREVWALDTGKINSWPIALARAEGSSTLDLFVEPVQTDAFNLDYAVGITFDNGETVSAPYKAATHTNNQMVVDAANPPPPLPAAAPAADDAVEVHLADGGTFRGRLLSIADESAVLVPSFGEELRVPLLKLRGLRFLAPSAAAGREQFAARLGTPEEQDVALVLGQDQSVTPLSGTVEGLANGRLQFTFEGKRRSLNVARLVGLVLAKHPVADAPARLEQIFELTSGERIVGQWTGYTADSIELSPSWGGRLTLPASVVERIACRNGRVVFLSDLEPVAVEEAAWFGRVLPWRKDQGLLGGPLAVRGQTFGKGLAVHGRCVLTYALDGGYESLQAIVGFEESAQGLGRVACRVLGDGRELFAEPDFRGDADPRPVQVDLAGVEVLTLEIDFGEGEDVGDRVVWGNARLFKVRQAAAE